MYVLILIGVASPLTGGMTLGLSKAVLDAVCCIYTVVFGVWMHDPDQLHVADHKALQGFRSQSPRGTGCHILALPQQPAQGLPSCSCW